MDIRKVFQSLEKSNVRISLILFAMYHLLLVEEVMTTAQNILGTLCLRWHTLHNTQGSKSPGRECHDTVTDCVLRNR